MALTQVKALGLAADSIDASKLADDSIDSEHYANASIDHAHLANDAVDGDNIADDSINSEHYVDGSIDHAHLADDCVDGDNIADNSVGLAAMAGGTDGVIITYDASGNPVPVGPGTDGQVLTSTGAGSPPAFETIAAGNTPAFLAGFSDQFSFSGDQWVKDTSMTSLYASNAAFDDSTNDRWTPGVAGKYYCWFSSTFFSGNGLYTYRIRISKNAEGYDSGYDGGEDFFAEGRPNVTGDDHPEYCLSIATIIDMDADDYIEAWLWHAGSGVTRSFHGHHFGAFKIA